MKISKIKFTLLLLIIALSMMVTVACSQDETKPAETSTTTERNRLHYDEVAAEKAEIKTMTGEELVAQNSDKKKDEVIIIDVRSSEEYKAGHIPNAININVMN